MSILFTPVKIGHLTIPNRFVRSATHDYMADDEGNVTDANVELYRHLAEGEVGLIITGHAHVQPSSKVMPRELLDEEIRVLISDFVAAAERAKRAGFDGVQLHAAHGYLLSSFLSPHTNRSADNWGGPIENRARVLVEILRGVKAVCGRDFPVIVKLNSTDFLEGGLFLEDAVQVALKLEAEGIDGTEASGGSAEAGRGAVRAGP